MLVAVRTADKDKPWVRDIAEAYRSREGQHLYIYPFAGRNVHLGLASLIAWRLARERPNTFSISIDDYGSGLSSLAYLKQIRADELKIDKAVVSSMACDDSDRPSHCSCRSGRNGVRVSLNSSWPVTSSPSPARCSSRGACGWR